MINLALVPIVVPIETEVGLFGIDSRPVIVLQLVCKFCDTQYIHWGRQEVQYLVNIHGV